jgi:hypothetical protein
MDVKNHFSQIVKKKMFHQMQRIGLDESDLSQRELMNRRQLAFSAHDIAHTVDHRSDYVHFATHTPALMYNGVFLGKGLDAARTSDESTLLYTTNRTKLDYSRKEVNQRPFLVVPYLGRGSVDPSLESQLQQGDRFIEKKEILDTVSRSGGISSYAFVSSDSFVSHRDKDPTMFDVSVNDWKRGGDNTR